MAEKPTKLPSVLNGCECIKHQDLTAGHAEELARLAARKPPLAPLRDSKARNKPPTPAALESEEEG